MAPTESRHMGTQQDDKERCLPAVARRRQTGPGKRPCLGNPALGPCSDPSCRLFVVYQALSYTAAQHRLSVQLPWEGSAFFVPFLHIQKPSTELKGCARSRQPGLPWCWDTSLCCPPPPTTSAQVSARLSETHAQGRTGDFRSDAPSSLLSPEMSRHGDSSSLGAES